MITLEDWEEFDKYRGECWLKAHKYVKENFKSPETKIKKHKFLWFKWETKQYPSYWENYFYEYKKSLIMLDVPPRTLEACLDFLSRKKIRREGI